MVDFSSEMPGEKETFPEVGLGFLVEREQNHFGLSSTLLKGCSNKNYCQLLLAQGRSGLNRASDDCDTYRK